MTTDEGPKRATSLLLLILLIRITAPELSGKGEGVHKPRHGGQSHGWIELGVSQHDNDYDDGDDDDDSDGDNDGDDVYDGSQVHNDAN